MKKILPILFSILLLLSSCKSPTKDDKIINEFKDYVGNEVNIEAKPERVVSLMGSLGHIWKLSGGHLIGVTNDVIEENRFEVDDSTKIVGTIKEPNLEEVLSLDPDFVILSTDIPSHVKFSETLKNLNIDFGLFKVETFSQYLNLLDFFTDLTGNKDYYKEYGLDVKKKIDEEINLSKSNKSPSCLLLRAYSTGFKAKGDDSVAGEILKDLGVINIASLESSLLENINNEIIIKNDPDFIFIVPMGSQSEKFINNLKNSFFSDPAYSNLSAVKGNKIYILDKNLFHYKPNNKWGNSYEELRKILYE